LQWALVAICVIGSSGYWIYTLNKRAQKKKNDSDEF
jgi:hypothetical protein